MAKVPVVKITGLDATLIRIEGVFSRELDTQVLNLEGRFVKKMDSAAARVFEAMAKDINVEGIVARRVMGSHAKTPKFLLENGAPQWEKLSPKYMKAKKKVSNTTFFWQYSGGLINTFRKQSQRMTRLSNNTARYEVDSKGKARLKNKVDPNDILFKPLKAMPAQGRNIGTRSKNYDIIYDESQTTPQVNYSAKSPKSGAVSETYVKQMSREITFGLFNGFTRFLIDGLNGKVSSSPEEYIMYEKSNSVITKKSNMAGKVGNLKSVSTTVERQMNLGRKLWYAKNGEVKKRELIQPYIKYYVKRVMIPLAEKTIGTIKV